ncbi:MULTISPECIES: hypothetical protein [Kitasatospora]|uniref:Uncharacterized protein n=1 Tax=Kitasatospora acidiphila TaxID=2567942 RepID=A0A540W9C4_9ACTN|nr:MULTISPECIES: hypothetical protein [Kitasatospora]MDH6138858.1 hypothetical protein [Kitasatospora sp. GP30]TQF05598.1 hypothetical protein E6W39_29410 [Kitasatospora acidiphila]
MPWGDHRSANSADSLRLAAAVAEIEGLHAALQHTTDPGRRRRLRADLARAAARLASLAAAPPGAIPQQARGNSRRGRRRAALVRGARWLADRLG